jgi:hypothetical protein
MKNYIDKMTDLNSPHERREFSKGAMGQDKFNAQSFASGMFAAWLLNQGRKNGKNQR